MVAKQGSLFLLCGDDGDIQADSDQGVYFHDMRYISAESLRFNDTPPVSLLADASKGHLALFELTNLDLEGATGEVRVRKESLGIRREKCLGDDYTEIITDPELHQRTSRVLRAFTLRSRFRRHVRRARHAPG